MTSPPTPIAITAATEEAELPPSALVRQRTRAAWLFMLPTLVAMGLVAGWPLGRTLWFSFTDANLTDLGASQFVGLASLQSVLEDPDWWTTVWTTFRFAFVSGAVEAALGVRI